MPLEIVTLRALEGPNIYMPQPGIFLCLRADKDRSRRLRDALKDGAQAVGLVLGFLECSAQPQGDHMLISCHFSTPQPALARDLAVYVVEGINRQLAHDEEWDADGPLFELQKRRRREMPPLGLLQIMAEARQRGLPVLRTPNGRTQIGYGARAWSFDAGQFDLGLPVASVWERIGVTPVVAATGERAGACVTQLSGTMPAVFHQGDTEALRAQLAGSVGRAVPGNAAVVTNADFDQALAALCDSTADLIMLGLEATAIVERGLPFYRCAISAIVDAGSPTPGVEPVEQLRALGLPLLLTDPAGRAVLNADEPELLDLAGYARCPLTLFSARGETETIAQHRSFGGEALFVAGEKIIRAQGLAVAAELPLSAAGPDLTAGLAALGVLWGLEVLLAKG